ncbi:MAG TPA: hypothetical protein VGL71_02410 [Urbifossiella sp.]
MPDALHPTRVNLIRVINSIRPNGIPRYPAIHDQLSLFAQLTECRGEAKVRVEIRNADTDQVVFRTRTRDVTFSNEPLVVHGLRFRMIGCPFPDPGLYLVQLWYDEGMLAEIPIMLKA